MKKVKLVFSSAFMFDAYVFEIKPNRAFINRENLSIATFLDDDGLFVAGTEYQAKITFLELVVKSSYLSERYYPFCTIYPHLWSQAVWVIKQNRSLRILLSSKRKVFCFTERKEGWSLWFCITLTTFLFFVTIACDPSPKAFYANVNWPDCARVYIIVVKQ